MRKMRNQKSLQTGWPILLALLVSVLILSGCLNPFHSKSDTQDPTVAASNESGSTGGIEITVSSPLRLSTIAPDGTALASSIAHYSVRLVDPSGTFSDVTRSNVSPGSFPLLLESLHAITWNLTVTAYNSAGFEVGSSGVVSAVVTSGVTPVSVTITALQTGSADGSLTYNLSWPSGRVNVSASSVTLMEVTNTADPLSGAVPYPGFTEGSDYNFIGDTQLNVNTQVPSGTYYLEVQLHSPAGVDHPPIYEAVQVYDHLGSSKSVTLTAAEFTDPPGAPANPIVVFAGENSFALRWSDTVNTELGFRVYEQGFGAPVADVGPGIEVAPALTSQSYSGAPIDVTFEIYAYNAFGESPTPLLVDFRVVPAGQLSSFLASTHTNQPSWAAANDAGRLDWGTLVPGGADTTNIYVSSTNNLNDVTALPAAAASPGSAPFPLSTIAPFVRGNSYSWRVELVKSSGNPVRVFTPVSSFSVRNPAIYVDRAAGVPGAAGSSGDPIDSAGEAITMAESGETIYLTAGNYVEPLSTVPSNVSVSGSWNAAFSSQDPWPPTTLLRNSSGQYTLDLQNGPTTISRIEVQSGTNATATGAVRLNGGELSINECQIWSAVVNTPGDGPTNAYGILLQGGTGVVTIENSEFLLDASSDSGSISQIRIGNNYSGQAQIQGNTFLSPSGGLNNAGALYGVDLQSGGATTVTVSAETNVFDSGIHGSANMTIAFVNSFRPDAQLVVSDNSMGEIAGPGSFFGVRVASGADSVHVFDNQIECQSDNGNEYAVSIEGPAPDVRIFNNRIRNVVPPTSGSSYGIEVQGTSSTPLIYNNVVHGEGTSGLWFYGITAYNQPVTALHNTIVTGHAGPSNLISIRPNTQNISGVTVSNNILRRESGTSVTGVYANGTNTVTFSAIRGNVISGTTTPYRRSDNTALTIADLNLESYGLGNIDVNPQLGAAGSWFPLTGSTPLVVGAGGDNQYTGTVTADINGSGRTVPVAPGAYEGGPSGATQFAMSARWDFEPGSELADSSLNNNVLTDLGAAAFVAQGGRNSLRLDEGTDQLRAGPTPTLDRSADGETLSFWYFGNTFPLGSLIHRYTTGNSRLWSLSNNVAGSNGEINVLDSGGYVGGGIYPFASSFGVGWNHLAASFNTDTGQVTVYANGSLVATRNFVTGSLGSSYHYVGRRPGATGSDNAAIPVHLDDIRLFSRPLSQAEGQRIYNE